MESSIAVCRRRSASKLTIGGRPSRGGSHRRGGHRVPDDAIFADRVGHVGRYIEHARRRSFGQSGVHAIGVATGSRNPRQQGRPGTLERWGLGYEAVLSQRYPRLIHCHVSGFGAAGPLGGYPGYDAAIQGMAGLMSLNGEAEGEPLRVGVPVVDLATGLNAALAIMMALQERHRSGKGQLVEATLFGPGGGTAA